LAKSRANALGRDIEYKKKISLLARRPGSVNQPGPIKSNANFKRTRKAEERPYYQGFIWAWAKA
jgi:hypothetical protein